MADSSEMYPALPTPQISLSRLAHEMELLVEKSLALQGGIHTLDLSTSDPQTRKVLQSADTITQTLVCLRVALEGLSLSNMKNVENTNTGFEVVQNDIFLHDVRDRLLNGAGAEDSDLKPRSGSVDIF